MTADLNAVIQPSRVPVTDIISGMRGRNYFVDDSFQRKLVWTEKQKVRLIETILINYPVPEIYLWEQGADPESGSQKYSIVDGQQRMNSLLQFVSNEWPLKTIYLDDAQKTGQYSGKYWKDLSDECKRSIWQYLFTVRTIPSSVNKEEIRAVFRRLNETDKSLNPQELRNAEFNGEFIKAAETVADLPFWSEWKIFPDSQVRRMVDIEFASSLLIFLRKGIVSDSSASLNAVYDTYNDLYEDSERDISKIKEFVDFLETQLKKHEEIKTMFTKTNNIYVLFCVYISYIEKGESLESRMPRLIEFIKTYNSDSPTEKEILNYKEGASSSTRSKTSREQRVFSLIDWLNNAKI